MIWAIAFTFASTFQCGTRPAAYWTTVQTIAQFCGDFGGLNVAMCFTDLFIDVLILVAPVIMIWNMNFNIWRKIQILGVFALGFLSTAAAATRVYIMWQDAYATNPGHNNLLKENTKIIMWCLIEVSSALIACCLPVLRPIVSETWLNKLYCRLQDRLSSRDKSCPSSRELEEGMAFQSIGGTDFRAVCKRESMSRKDSKMSTNVDAREIDGGSSREIDSTSKEIELSKEVEVEER
ncbi:hypothetical protein N0V90_004160 [Kalmusia sp. IMI 367209]|nr:hypothetical protein N0V90_004160 [Kalmusia sp. IMI 367209]